MAKFVECKDCPSAWCAVQGQCVNIPFPEETPMKQDDVVDAKNFVWAYTPAEGYQSYPPYINISVRDGKLRIHARGPERERSIDKVLLPGDWTEFDLPLEALAELQASLSAQPIQQDDVVRPPKHDFWGAGEPDCPRDIKAGNGELHTLQCKVCGEKNPPDEFCWNAAQHSDLADELDIAAHDIVKAAYRAGAKDILSEWQEVCECAPLLEHTGIGETADTYWKTNQPTILTALRSLNGGSHG